MAAQVFFASPDLANPYQYGALTVSFLAGNAHLYLKKDNVNVLTTLSYFKDRLKSGPNILILYSI